MHELGYYLEMFFSVETEGQQELCWNIIINITCNENQKINRETTEGSKIL